MDQWTYILENKAISATGQGNRRYYVGRTNNMVRRMLEHTKDRCKSYNLIWHVAGNYERKIKNFGASAFMECLKEGNKK